MPHQKMRPRRVELPYDEQQAETMIEHDHQLTGDAEAEQGFQSSEGDSELLYWSGARSHICRHHHRSSCGKWSR